MLDNLSKTNHEVAVTKTKMVDENLQRVVFDDHLLTTKDLAKYINLKPATIMKWRREPELDYPKFIKLGKRRIRYKKSDVEAWLNRNPFFKL